MWLSSFDVAAADSGRIVAARNEPGKTARLSWFKVWEPDGTPTVVVFGAEQWNGGTQTIGKIGVVSIQGIEQGPVPPVDCCVPASGVAKDPSGSPDAGTIAWTDGQGLKSRGRPGQRRRALRDDLAAGRSLTLR